MQTKIEQYSYDNIAKINGALLEYRDTIDYRNFFASKEWLLSFLELYKPKVNFLIRSNNGQNYFSLSVFNGELVFTGNPFNDFNSVLTKTGRDLYNFGEIIKYFSELGYKIKWNNLFELHLLKALSEFGKIQVRATCLKITHATEIQGYDVLVSNKIRQMYEKFSDSLSFFRTFGNGIQNDPTILEDLLRLRQDKLLNQKKKEYNLSFENTFNEFIKKLSNFNSLEKNLFIDYCTNKDGGEIVAASFNFIKDKKVICYLRAHAQSKNNISYGLILDYWSNRKNFNNGIQVIDLTRGDESYKYRLGAKEYKINNFATI